MFKSLSALTILLTSACSAASPTNLNGHSPYGIWTTERGHVVVITRDGNYTYCDKAACTQGPIKTEGAFGVTLKGFMANPVTRSLRVESGEEELSAAASRTTPDFDFTEKGSGMSSDLRKNLCNDRPCVTIGNLEDNVHRFIKIEDF